MPLIERLPHEKVPLRFCYRPTSVTRETAIDPTTQMTSRIIIIGRDVYTSDEKGLRTKIGETPYRIN
jgi:hypothetical protein